MIPFQQNCQADFSPRANAFRLAIQQAFLEKSRRFKNLKPPPLLLVK
jgi:hypothetical protein